jgi:biopolymer transport protein ExbD
VSVSIKHWYDNDNFSFHLNGNETPVRFDQIEDGLIDLLQNEEDPTFSIYADETVPIKEVVKVMNIAKRNHYKVIMATSPE